MTKPLTINEQIKLATYVGVVGVRSGHVGNGKTCYKLRPLTALKGNLAFDRACSDVPMAVGRKYLIVAYAEKHYLTISYEMLIVSQDKFPEIAPIKRAVLVGPPSSSQPFILLRNLPKSYDMGIITQYSPGPLHYDATTHFFSYYSLYEVKHFFRDLVQACTKNAAKSKPDPCLQVMRKWSFFSNQNSSSSQSSRKPG